MADQFPPGGLQPPPPGGSNPPPPPPPQGGYQPQPPPPPPPTPPGGSQSPPPLQPASPMGITEAEVYPSAGAVPSPPPQGGTSPLPPPPPKPSKPANFQLGALLAPVLKIKITPHSLQFDEQYFLHLLAGSISLTKDEKARIIESIPKLKQTQIDELIRIFEEERLKFAELGEEHVAQLDKLARQHYEDWMDIEMQQEQSSKASEDAKKAEELRKQLGL